MGAQAVELEAPRAVRANWIISEKQDLTWFIGSSLAGYLALALMAAGFPLTPLFLVWLIGIDGPHVLATVTRTYFDKAERKRLGLLLLVIIPAAMLGPVAVMLGYESLFYLFAVSWLHFHIAKQHFGFVMLYKHKNGERDSFDYHLDRWFLLASLMLPYICFVVATADLLKTVKAAQVASDVLLAAYLALAVIFVARQVQKARQGLPVNLPKLLLFLAVVPLQWLAFGYAATFGFQGIVRAGVVAGLFHSFQYHRLMWFHNNNRYREPQGEDRFGLAATLARRCAYYALAAVALNLVLNVLPTVLFSTSPLKAAVWGLAFTHYMLDARIWRVRGDRELAAALHL
ncbi:MAG TPA: hypothetical protein VMT86_17125 [Bryobacteraceae bacterium]|nr:hypothetical protein [Bryobacteraceae bacterium]